MPFVQATVQRIIDLFNDDVTLKDATVAGGPGTAGVKKWFFDLPPVQAQVGYPYGYVQFLRTADRPSTVSKGLKQTSYYIAVFTQSADVATAVKNAEDLLENVVTMLKANRDLSRPAGQNVLAVDSWPQEWDAIQATEEGDRVNYGLRLTFVVLRHE